MHTDRNIREWKIVEEINNIVMCKCESTNKDYNFLQVKQKW
jgi:hypothetical protein